MTTYTYRCRECQQIHEVEKHSDYASASEFCPVCEGINAEPPGYYGHPPMQRIYDHQRRAIVRPRGFNLRPGERDPTVPGLSYSNFAHELARGELTEDATAVYTPESRARREAALAAEDEGPRSLAAIDRDIPERAHQELHEWARAAYSHLEEERRYA